ncbi:MAG: metallophosphoesterase family protein [Chloroflexota bacterium]|nr:metallophosphoesterase family protein [Chloroflexota bacterium]
MKIAVLADIHGNFPALQAVGDNVEGWGPDLVFVVGDTINRGPRSKDCLQFVRQKRTSDAWRVIRGNHEDYVLSFEESDAPTHGPHFEMMRSTYWNYQQLTPNEIASIKALPYQIEETVLNREVIRAVHGSMLGIRKGIYPNISQEDLAAKIAPAPQILMVGHTHKPLIRTLDGTLIINAGSVGLPFDGDTHPSYAQIHWQDSHWEAKIIRVDYDREAAIHDFYESGFLTGGRGMAKIILSELKLARSLISPWLKRYKEAVMAKEISMEEAVEEFLGGLREDS